MKLRFLALVIFSIIYFPSYATTVIPFDNIGHLSESSDEIIIATVISEHNDTSAFRSWNVQIQHSFKGKFLTNQILNIESMNLISSKAIGNIAGDIKLDIGAEYLFFLDQNENGVWRPMTMSYYLYQSFELSGKKYFVPVKESLEIHIEGQSNGIFIINPRSFIPYLEQHQGDNYIYPWDDTKFIARKKIADFYPELRAAPSHCTFLSSGGHNFRWDIFPDFPLEIYCDTEVDAGYADSHLSVSDAIVDMSNDYIGTNLSDEGVVSTNYNPTCSGGSATSGNFSSFSNGLNGGENILVIFNDPCNQITNLSGCSGTLAIGGSFGSTPFNQHDGMDWFTSSNAYVIVNNGTGACQSANGYKSVMTHEMTHGLGLGHIASGNGAANMNPSCCNNITSLDIQCLDYVYPPSGGLPLDLVVTEEDITCYNLCDGSISIDQVTNGVAPITYAWSNGGNLSSIDNLCPNTYTVTVTDGNASTISESYTITEPSELITTITTVHTSCGQDNGSAFAQTTGGTPSYNYDWNNSATTAFIENLSTGTYAVTVTDNNSCTSTAITVINPSAIVNATVTTTNETANNANDGTATCTTISGLSPFTYLWNNGETTSTITGLAPGTYTITVTDDDDCTFVTSGIVAEYICPTLSIIAVFQEANCATSCDGSITISSVTNSVPPLTYFWGNGSTLATNSNLCVGSHSVTITDAKNCSVTDLLFLSAPDIIEIHASATDETSLSSNDGTASCNPNAGVPPYSYLWSNGETTQNIINLVPGDYTITVTDDHNCFEEETVTVLPYICPTQSINIVQTDIICFGACTGSLSIVGVTNGSSPYDYIWDTGATTSTILNLCSGDYTVTVTDDKNCESIETYTITEPTEISLVINSTNTSCGDNNGSASVNVVGGTSPYTYLWNNGVTIDTIINLSAGTYSITVTDSNNCIKTKSIIIAPSDLVSVNISGTNESSNGANDGTATCAPAGGSSPYTYLWNNGNTTQSISDLSPGYYLVVVTDINGCLNEEDITIAAFQCPILTVYSTQQNIKCYSNCDGRITIDSIQNGSLPYTYSWSNGSTSNFIDNLCQDTFYITITDADNCTVSDTFYMLQPDILTSNTTVTNESSNGANDGSATANPSGGTSPYSYNWSNGETTPQITNLSPGDYFLTLTDSNSCIFLDTVTIITYNCPILIIAQTIVDIDCHNNCNAIIGIDSIINGAAPFTYLWSTGSINDTINDLCIGDYSVTIIDSKNCMVIDTFILTQPDPILSNITATNESSKNANDGTATVTPSGGVGTYRYLWNTTDTTQMISDLSPGSYTTTITDGNGCMKIAAITVAAYGCTGQSIITTQNNITCNNDCDGSLSITAIDSSVGPYSYKWSNGDSLQLIKDLCPGTYSVTVIDGNNCNVFASYIITEPNPLQAITVSTNEWGNNGNNGTATSNPIGGTTPYSYLWSNGDTTQLITNLSPGQYIIVITDINNCTTMDTVNIETYLCADLSITSTTNDVSCFAYCDGSIGITNVVNSQGPVRYNWSNSSTTSSIINLCADNYSITVTDTLNCEVIDSFVISEPSEIMIVIDSLTDVRTVTLGSIYITTSSNSTYSWIGPNGYTSNNEDITNLSIAGCYSLTITNSISNCTQDTTICIDDLTATKDDIELTSLIRVYPNPAVDMFVIDFSSTQLSEAIISMYDISGKMLWKREKSKNSNQLEINTALIHPGLYMIEIQSSRGTYTYKKVILSR